MPNQEKPPSPVAETYRPPAGIRHPVTGGETWIGLARRAGLDPWDLIDFNFPGVKLVKQRDFQLATRYVNWYLAQYVGCRAVSPDGQNFAFSSGATGGKGVWRGGVIYLPPGTPPPPPVSATPPAPTLTAPTCQAEPARLRTGIGQQGARSRAEGLWPNAPTLWTKSPSPTDWVSAGRHGRTMDRLRRAAIRWCRTCGMP